MFIEGQQIWVLCFSRSTAQNMLSTLKLLLQQKEENTQTLIFAQMFILIIKAHTHTLATMYKKKSRITVANQT